MIVTSRFQSTPSGGKATGVPRRARVGGVVSIHAFRGEGDTERYDIKALNLVSIHAFRGEGD